MENTDDAVLLLEQLLRPVDAFYRCQKTGLIDFPGKRVPTEVKYLLTVCQILGNLANRDNSKIKYKFTFTRGRGRHCLSFY